MKTKYQITLFVLAILIACATFIEVRYQKFLHVQELGDSIVLVDENLSINYLTGNHVRGSGTIKVHFSVTNVSNKDTNYFISLENINNITDNLNYSLKSSNNTNNVDYQPIKASDVIIGNNIVIKPGESIGYDLFINNASNIDMQLKVGYEKDYINLLRDLIFSNSTNIVKNSNSLGDSYYFSGSSNDNYVLINDIMFQIIKINNDNTIRLITTESIGNSVFLNNNYVAFLDYNSSNINTFLAEYYQANYQSFDSIIENNNYYSDVSIYNTINDTAYFNNYNNLVNNNIVEEYNNPYVKKIGLLSAFDYAMINGAENFLKRDNTEYYTSTYAYQSLGSFPNIVTIKNGELNYETTSDNELAIYPVINLNKDVFAIGSGTINNPYKIVYEK